ncbi:MAG TPA: LytR C-terminal domain-containing protein [Pseudonocardiaceae bacterium]|nr:LytR C-terminal domain-containing protein [Pseudonocardiaceae bacterium]
MSTPNGTGASRRMRNAGLALLGLAVIAVAVGAVATTGGQPAPAAAPAAATSPTTSAPALPSTIPYPPTSSRGAAPVVPPFGAPDAAQDVPAGQEQRVDQSPLDQRPLNQRPLDQRPLDQSHSRGEVRVYNNSTIRGLAARAAEDLTAAGWTVVEVGNYAQGAIPTTTAYYQEGIDQRDDAEALGAEFGMRVEPRFAGIANADSGLIVIVTNDYVSP